MAMKLTNASEKAKAKDHAMPPIQSRSGPTSIVPPKITKSATARPKSRLHAQTLVDRRTTPFLRA